MNANQFVVDYAEYIYKTAYKCYWKLKSKPRTEEEEDFICDIAVKIIETFSTQISEGEFKFRGEAKLEVFLYGAVYNAMKEKIIGKPHIPRAVDQLGSVARNIYHLRYLNNFSRKDALELIYQETRISRDELEHLDKEIAKVLKTTIVQRGGAARQNDVRESELEDFMGEMLFSGSETPESELIRGELRSKIITILQCLKPLHRDIIRLRFIEQVETEEILTELGLKDRQAVFNNIHSARNAFIKEAQKQNLLEWTEYNFKGMEDERRKVPR